MVLRRIYTSKTLKGLR